MKVSRLKATLVVVLFASACAFAATTTVNESNKWAWAANSGWVNCRPDSTNGAVIGQFYCSGYFWSSSTGWIILGDGSPTNGIQYSNAAADDYGVNHDGKGNLRGYAWSDSTGWINFESTGAPKVDLKTGILSGYAWGGSLGWISFTNVQAFSKTDSFYGGPDNDKDGIPDPWEVSEAGSTSVLSCGVSDYDDDGCTDSNEYVCGTDPQDDTSYLRITSVRAVNGTNYVTWTCEPTRVYRVEKNLYLTNGVGWGDSGAGDITTSSTTNVTKKVPFDGQTQGFYRVSVFLPLSPP